MKRILKNFSVLSVGTIASKVFSYAALIYLTRILGTEGFGKLSFAQAFVSYFILFVTFGLHVIGAREVAKNYDTANKYLNNIIALRAVIAVFAFSLLAIIVFALTMSFRTKAVILSYGLLLFVNIFNFDWFFQGFERMHFISAFKVLRTFLLLILLIFFVKHANDLIMVSFSFVLSEALVALIAICSLHKGLSLFIRTLEFSFCKYLIKESFPVFMTFFMALVYYNSDVVLLQFLKGEAIVGIYSAAYRIILLGIIPITLWLQAFAPSLSQHFFDYGNFWKFVRGNLIIGLVSSLMIITLAKYVVLFSYGDKFFESIGILRILSIMPLLSAVAGSFANVLSLWNLQGKQLLATATGAIVNITLNLLLIPKYGMVGAAAATAAAELSVAAIASYFVCIRYKTQKSRVHLI